VARTKNTTSGREARRRLTGFAACAALLLLTWVTGAGAHSATGPGNGKSVTICTSTGMEGMLVEAIPLLGLQQLGYKPKWPLTLSVPAEHQAVATGDCTYMIDEWVPLHNPFYAKVADKAMRIGPVVLNAGQGYLIDKKTAQQYHITSLSQFSDPKIAKLFASSTPDKADLCCVTPGWGAELVAKHELSALSLTDTVNLVEGDYFTLFAQTLANFKQGKPILFYTWTPNWTLNLLKPGKDVIWLNVPASACDASQPCGSSTSGFPSNNIHVLANRSWMAANPAARKFLSLVRIPISAINAENQLIQNGQKAQADVMRHAQQWIAAHRALFNSWLRQARAAAT
jgi:glycine betaine/proline transport system substrate-binding protein